MHNTDDCQWINLLAEEDIILIKRFVLLSGSLKDLATAYNISYPTLRRRLDRTIARIKAFDGQKIEDDYERLLRDMFAARRMNWQLSNNCCTST